MTATEETNLRKREPVSVRLSGYTLTDLKACGERQARKIGPAPLAESAIEAFLGYARCKRCGEAVPFTYGDLQGKPPSCYVGEARWQVRFQKCNAHEPVLIGAEPAGEAQDRDSGRDEAATREGAAQERTEPPAAVPAQGRKVPRQRKEPPVLVAAESAPAATVAQLRQDIPGVVTASELAGPAAVFRSPDPADDPFTPAPVPVPPVPGSRAKQGLADCRHPVNVRNGDICGKCHQQVRGKKQ